MIPTTIRVPIFSVEIDPSRAATGPSTLHFKSVLIGNKVSTGAIANGVLTKCSNYADARRLSGDGSTLERMSEAWFASSRFIETYLYSIDDTSWSAATGSIAISGTPTEAGTLVVYIGGRRIAVPVTTSSTPTTLGDAIVAAMVADTRVPATGVNTTGTIALTAKNKGVAGGETVTAVKKPTIDVRINYYDGEVTPAGLTVTVTEIAGGTGSPDSTAWGNFFTALGNDWIQVIVGPWFDSTSLGLIETELAARYAYDQMLDALYYTAKPDTKANLSTFGNTRNSPHVQCIGVYKPNGIAWQWAAASAAQGVMSAQENVSLPPTTLELVGLLPPARADQFDPISDNNVLLYDGITTYTVGSDGKCRIQRAITMYQKNAAGADDTAYLDTSRMYQIMYMRYDWRSRIVRKYSRCILVDDASRIKAGIPVITPAIGKAEAIAAYVDWEELGLVEDSAQFKADVICTRNLSDPNRMDWLLPPNLANQFLVGATTIQFIA